MGILSFAADSEFVELGQAATLIWKTKDCTDCKIEPPGVSVQANGILKVRPNRDTTYRLTCQSESSPTESSVTVRVATRQGDAAHRAPSGNAATGRETAAADATIKPAGQQSAAEPSASLDWKDDTADFEMNAASAKIRVIDCKDFVPGTMQKGRLFRNAQFVDFPRLIQAMNEWITHNKIEVFRIETIVIPGLHDAEADSDSGTKTPADESESKFWNQILRVWYHPQTMFSLGKKKEQKKSKSAGSE